MPSCSSKGTITATINRLITRLCSITTLCPPFCNYSCDQNSQFRRLMLQTTNWLDEMHCFRHLVSCSLSYVLPHYFFRTEAQALFVLARIAVSSQTLRRTLIGDSCTTFGQGREEFSSSWCYMVFRHAPIPKNGSSDKTIRNRSQNRKSALPIWF